MESPSIAATIHLVTDSAHRLENENFNVNSNAAFIFGNILSLSGLHGLDWMCVCVKRVGNLCVDSSTFCHFLLIANKCATHENGQEKQKKKNRQPTAQ